MGGRHLLQKSAVHSENGEWGAVKLQWKDWKIPAPCCRFMFSWDFVPKLKIFCNVVHQLLFCPIRPSEPWPWFWSLGEGKRKHTLLKCFIIPAAATSLCYHGSITTMQQQGVWVSWNWNQNSGDWSQPQGHQGGYDSYGYANAGYQNQGKGGGYGYDDSYGGSYSCSVQNLFHTHWIFGNLLNILAWHPSALRRSWL